MATSAQRPQRRPGSGILARLGRDYAYVLPGFFLSLAAFVVLVPLFSLGLGTFVVWVGAVIMPFTLMLAGWFADLSRTRLRAWGAEFRQVRYLPRAPGIVGFIKTMGDGRRWLDLLFETLIALPLRIFTFTVSVTWSAVALGGLTYWFWGRFVPGNDELVELLLEDFYGDRASLWLDDRFAVETVFYLVLGVIAIVALPFVMRGLAHLDALVTRAALLGPDGPPVSLRPRSGLTSADVGNEPNAQAKESSETDSLTRAATGSVAAGIRQIPRTNAVSNQSMSGEGWSWLAAAIMVIAAFSISLPVLYAIYDAHPALALAVTVVHAVAILLVVRWPFIGIPVDALAVLGTALLTASTVGIPWPWPVMTMLLHFTVLLLVALRRPWQWALASWLSGAVVSILTLFMIAPGFIGQGGLSGALANSIVAVAIGLGLVIFGVVARALAVSRGQLASERRLTSEQLEKRRELEERNRIAGELHDVVAHSMSVIGVQATTAKYRIEDMDERVADEFDSIADASRRALSEMRGLLSLLRTGEEAPLAPQPELAQINRLIEDTRRAGATIEFLVDDQPASAASLAHIVAATPSATGLTAYRTVQEALSNALRHSPGADISVHLESGGDELRVRVTNGPAEDALAGQEAPGSGLGLPGIRSRVEALGGTVTAGALDNGGYELSARLPLG